MAFVTGEMTVNTNFNVGYAGPLDNRSICDYVADLLTAPYAYVGMTVVVTGESSSSGSQNGLYMLIAEDATVASNWKLISAF